MAQWIDSLMDGYCISAETKSYTTSTGNDKSIYLITKELKPLSHCEIAVHIKRGNT